MLLTDWLQIRSSNKSHLGLNKNIDSFHPHQRCFDLLFPVLPILLRRNWLPGMLEVSESHSVVSDSLRSHGRREAVPFSTGNA